MFVCAYICRTGNKITEEEEEEAFNALQADNPDDAELDSDLEMSSVLESGANESIIDIALNNEVLWRRSLSLHSGLKNNMTYQIRGMTLG